METISRRQSFSEKGINVMSEKEKIIVYFKILDIEFCMTSFLPRTLKEENSGISKPLKELKNILGKSIIGNTIPLIIP